MTQRRRGRSPAWPEVELHEIAEEITVGHVGPMVDQYQAAGIPFLRSQNVDRYSINQNELRYIPTGFHEQLRKSRLRPGDVVVVRTGEPGKAAVVPDWLSEANCADLVIIRPSPRLNARYLVYFINAAAAHQVSAQLVGAVQQHFNVGSARKLRLPLPERPEQDAIAGVLGALDDKIELNREMSRTLEAMAQALFKSWFVDFDPVVAKAAGRQPFRMDAETAALFPSRFTESDLGPVPAGWRGSTIGAEVRVVGGSTPSSDESQYWGGAVRWLTPRDLSRLEGPIVLETERHITEQGLARISSGLLPVGTVLLSSRAPIGYLAIASVPLAVNQGFVAMVCERSLGTYYVFHWARENMDEVVGRAGGTTFAEISKASFRPIPILVPSDEVLAVFEALQHKWYSHIASNAQENLHLASLRDALLPKLLSGEIRVKDAEREAERSL